MRWVPFRQQTFQTVRVRSNRESGTQPAGQDRPLLSTLRQSPPNRSTHWNSSASHALDVRAVAHNWISAPHHQHVWRRPSKTVISIHRNRMRWPVEVAKFCWKRSAHYPLRPHHLHRRSSAEAFPINRSDCPTRALPVAWFADQLTTCRAMVSTAPSTAHWHAHHTTGLCSRNRFQVATSLLAATSATLTTTVTVAVSLTATAETFT